VVNEQREWDEPGSSLETAEIIRQKAARQITARPLSELSRVIRLVSRTTLTRDEFGPADHVEQGAARREMLRSSE